MDGQADMRTSERCFYIGGCCVYVGNGSLTRRGDPREDVVEVWDCTFTGDWNFNVIDARCGL